MVQEARTVRYDAQLHLEAYRFVGVLQPFPNHFHDYYVIGLVESGRRLLSCKNRNLFIGPGDMLLLNPHDSHGCVPSDCGSLGYRGINIPKDTMASLAEELTGPRVLPSFSEPVIRDMDIARYFQVLHSMILEGSEGLEKEELLLLLLSSLWQRYGQPLSWEPAECGREVEAACAFMEAHLGEHITLEQMCHASGLSKSTLLRSFTKAKGVTPYRYLQAIRIDRGKALLERGVLPIDVASQTGFSDQSHFTNAFHSFIGLSPAAYRRIFQEKRKES